MTSFLDEIDEAVPEPSGKQCSFARALATLDPDDMAGVLKRLEQKKGRTRTTSATVAAFHRRGVSTSISVIDSHRSQTCVCFQ